MIQQKKIAYSRKISVFNNCIKSYFSEFSNLMKQFGGEQIKDNKCGTKSAEMLHIALFIVVKYIH